MSEEIKSNDLKSYKKGTIIINGEIFPPPEEMFKDKANKKSIKKMRKNIKRTLKNKI